MDASGRINDVYPLCLDSGVIAKAYRFIDWFIPSEAHVNRPNALQRSRLLVFSSYSITLIALGFFWVVLAIQGLSPTAWAFIVGCPLLLVNPFLLRLTRSYMVPSILFAAELLVHLAFMAYHNGGYDSASLVWNTPIPLLVAFLMGPWIGLFCALIIVAETIIFYLLDHAGYPFPQPLSGDWMRWFHMAGTSTMVVFVALIGWFYDAMRKRAQETLEEAQKDLERRVTERTTALQRLNEQLGTEVAERKEAEKALRASETQLRTITDAVPTALLIYQDTQFCYVNAATEALSGYTQKELLGMHFWELLHPDIQELARERGVALQQGEEVSSRCVMPILTKDGEKRWIDYTAGLIEFEGKPSVLGAAFDFTDRKHLEDQLRQSQKMEAIGTLAGGVAHEFNNLLAVILGYTELTQNQAPQGSITWGYLQEVLKAGGRAKDLVQQILAFSRHSEVRREPLPFHHIVHEILTLLRASLPTTIAFQTHVDQDVGVVLADPTQMHQIVMNLCTNAEYAMRETGGVLDIRLDAVKVDEAWATRHSDLQPGAYIRLTVRDTGPGIEPKVLERIFDPFFTTKDVGEGAGMGLAIVHGIVTSHGGAVTVESTVGVGTTFSIYLPQCAETSAGVTAPPEEEDEILQGAGRILFVDDEEALAHWGQAMLDELGYEVVSVTRSLEALEVFRRHPECFDLVITDQTMPDMTGEQLAIEIRQIRPEIPIVICTGFSYVINAEKARAIGINAFCMKPLRVRELAATIQQVLKKENMLGAEQAP